MVPKLGQEKRLSSKSLFFLQIDPVSHTEILRVTLYLCDHHQVHCFPYISYLEEDYYLDSLGAGLLNRKLLKDLMQQRFALEFKSHATKFHIVKQSHNSILLISARDWVWLNYSHHFPTHFMWYAPGNPDRRIDKTVRISSCQSAPLFPRLMLTYNCWIFEIRFPKLIKKLILIARLGNPCHTDICLIVGSSKHLQRYIKKILHYY